MLGREEAAALGLHGLLAAFAQLAALHVSEYTAPAWATAHAEHERRVEAVEACVVQKLRELFGGCRLLWRHTWQFGERLCRACAQQRSDWPCVHAACCQTGWVHACCCCPSPPQILVLQRASSCPI